MAEEHEQPKVVVAEDPFVEDKIEEQEEEEKAKGSKLSSSSSSSSSSDSEDEDDVKHKVYRLFGREKPVHAVLGGGKAAEVLLWKNKKISGGVLGVATAVWVLFELLECHLLTLICYCLILLLSSFFFWSKTTTLINKSPPHIPEVQIAEDCAKETARALTFEIRQVVDMLRDIAVERDLRKFISVVAGLWVLSVVGSSFSFLTLSYIVILLLLTVPVLYEKYEDKVDPCAEKAILELKKHYAALETKVLTKLPKGFSKDKKH